MFCSLFLASLRVSDDTRKRKCYLWHILYNRLYLHHSSKLLRPRPRATQNLVSAKLPQQTLAISMALQTMTPRIRGTLKERLHFCPLVGVMMIVLCTSKDSKIHTFVPSSLTSFHQRRPTIKRPVTFFTVQKSQDKRMMHVMKMITKLSVRKYPNI